MCNSGCLDLNQKRGSVQQLPELEKKFLEITPGIEYGFTSHVVIYTSTRINLVRGCLTDGGACKLVLTIGRPMLLQAIRIVIRVFGL
jgi:hypothetical protein